MDPCRFSCARSVQTGVLLFALIGLGCGGAQVDAENSPIGQGSATLVPLAQDRALEIVLRAFERKNLPADRGVRLEITAGRTVPIDAVAQARNGGVEYLTAGDRRDLGDVLPVRPRGGALWILTAALPSTSDATRPPAVPVLLLTDSDYRFDPEPGGTGATQHDAEDRLEHAVLEFLDWLQSSR